MIDGADKYFNFEINPNGCLCLQFGPSKSDRINLVRQDDPDYAMSKADGLTKYRKATGVPDNTFMSCFGITA